MSWPTNRRLNLSFIHLTGLMTFWWWPSKSNQLEVD